MPTLDVSWVLGLAAFSDNTLVVTRTATTVGSNGLAVNTVTTFPLTGVVNIGTYEQYQNGSEASVGKRQIVVFTLTELYDQVVGYNPDVIVYQGSNYQVVKVWPWSSYGTGYYAADCEIQDTAAAVI